MIVVIMGVSGCGKTEVGSQLANKLGWKFYDADDYHPHNNKMNMGKGIPLNDQDRQPWLCKLHNLITRLLMEWMWTEGVQCVQYLENLNNQGVGVPVAVFLGYQARPLMETANGCFNTHYAGIAGVHTCKEKWLG
ncbi:probable gluconokinase isoform X2 [Aquarana catesbeiana]|uniref:probable gluconokinase isoform X2 n=1 Tax=Aquarana catesbeiana TaxID=8400 RepID=UPI003CC9984A